MTASQTGLSHWQQILKHLSDLCTNTESSRKALTIEPLHSIEQVLTSFQTIKEIQSWLKHNQPLQTQTLNFLELWFPELRTQRILDIKQIYSGLEFLELVYHIKNLGFCEKELCNFQNVLFDPSELIEQIVKVIDSRGQIRTTASGTLKSLYEEKKKLHKEVEHELNKMVKSYHIEHLLQDRFVTTREGRLVLPVKSHLQREFEGIIHDHSQTEKTVFIEPKSVVEKNNKIVQVDSNIKSEIYKILKGLSIKIKEKEKEIESAILQIINLDLYFGKARLAQCLKAQPVTFCKEINFYNLRHPLLCLQNKPAVGNDISLSQDKRALLLSGPNAGGKTTLLQSIGLACEMARHGLYTCADATSSLPFFEKIKWIIEDEQDIHKGYSAFSAHLHSLNQAVDFKGFQSLVLVDEICASTSPEEATALSKSYIKAFMKNKSFSIITSHLSQLKLGWDAHDNLIQGSLGFDLKTGPDYKFVLGVPGASFALDLAKKINTSPMILEQALCELDPKHHSHLEDIKNLKEERSKILTLQDQLKKKINLAQKKLGDYNKLIEDFKNQKNLKLEKILRSTEKKLEAWLQESRAKNKMLSYATHQKMKSQLPEIIQVKSSTTSITLDDFVSSFPKGTLVFINGINRKGVVQGEPNAKGDVPVLSDSIRFLVHWTAIQKI